jgi:hypothetical protein
VPPRERAEPGLRATWDQVLAWRLDRQQLTEPAMPMPAPPRGDDALVPLVRRLSGVHAQLASAAEAAIWLRTAGAVGPADVRRALAEDRTLVKTWAVRGTLHLLPAADLPRWAAALGTRSFRRPRSWYDYHGVTAEDMAAIEETVPQVLGAEPVTRERLAKLVAERSGRAQVEERLLSGWGAVLKPLAARGQLAFGPAAGRSVTFVAPREWLGSWQELDPERAVADTVRDFLDTYGPASQDELARWSALDRPVLRRAVSALVGELVELDTEGHRGWVTRTGAEQIAATRPSRVVRLLPGFDPFVVGALTQLVRLLPAGKRAAVSRTSGWISAVLVDGGRIVGTWTQHTRAGRLEVAVTAFAPLRPAVRKAAEAEAQRWADYAAAPLALSWPTS